MKKSSYFILITACCLLPVVLCGCATAKEAAKGFVGVSTKVLEEGRKDALRESFALDYASCYAKVKDILNEAIKVKDENDQEIDSKSYIYSEDAKQKMIAVYLSEIDTTPVGIFFIEESKARTLIEISSPSTYAKENIAARIFGGIRAQLKPAA